MSNYSVCELTIKTFHKDLEKGNVTCVDLIQAYLNRINAFDQNGPSLNSIIHINKNALKEAKELDDYYEKNGLKGALHGVPVLLKDNVDTCDMPTTAGSLSLKGFVPEKNAFIVEQMKQAGAIIIAKTNLHEFAIWGETISSILGQTKNPYDLTRTPGGSSGGTGASVAANLGLIGIGTDTINSIRSPASANNLVGIRPTIGLVSKAGVVPYSFTQDAIGPICRTVEDAVRFLEVLRGIDSNDEKTKLSQGQINENLCDHLKMDGLEGKRIGVLKTFFGNKGEHIQTNNAMTGALESLSTNGAEIIMIDENIQAGALVGDVSVHLHDFQDHLNAYLSQLPDRAPVHSVKEIIESGLHHEGIKENLIKASKLSTKTEAYESRLEKRKATQKQVLNMMDTYKLDAVLYPHQKQLVCEIGGSQNERNGVLGSVTGFPAICIPAGFSAVTETAPRGVPVGMEMLGRPFSEGILIEIAYAYEQLTNVRREPPTTPEL